MGFGQGYEQREPDVSVPEGNYQVKLGMPRDITEKGYNIRKIPIQIRNIPNVLPKTWDIFDIPRDDVEKIDKWNRQRTKDCDAFKVQRGDFRPQSWAGKVGWLHIGKNTKSGYMEVKWSMLESELSEPGPAPLPSKPAPIVQKTEETFNDFDAAAEYPENNTPGDYSPSDGFDGF